MESIKNLIYKYKNFKLLYRVLICLGLGLSSSYYFYTEQIEPLQANLEQVKAQLKTTQSQVTQALAGPAKLADLEVKRTEKMTELKSLQVLLPEEYNVTEFLRVAAQISQDENVTLQLFEPTNERLISGKTPYYELPIRFRLESTYYKSMEFLDNLLNRLGKLRMLDFEMKRLSSSAKDKNAQAGKIQEAKIFDTRTTDKPEENIDVETSVTVALLRSASGKPYKVEIPPVAPPPPPAATPSTPKKTPKESK